MSIFRTTIAPLSQDACSVTRRPRWFLSLALACAASGSLAVTATAESLDGHLVATNQRALAPLGDGSSGLGGPSIFGGEERLPSTTEQQRLKLPPLEAMTTAMDKIGTGSLPASFNRDHPNITEVLPEQVAERDPSWNWSTYCFSAPNTFSNPLYFEDVMLERHGHERFPMLQPAVSGVRFFATVPALPYLMTVRPPCECEYKMGHFRAGDCVHPYLQRPPYERKAAVMQGLTTAGWVVGLP